MMINSREIRANVGNIVDDEEREGRSKIEESTSEYSPMKIFAQTFGVFTEITNLVCAAAPPNGSKVEGAPQPQGFTAEVVKLLHGPVVEASAPLRSDAAVTLLPYHHAPGPNIPPPCGLANGSDALHHHIAAHSQLGTVTDFGPILEQLHSFPHLPLPSMYAPAAKPGTLVYPLVAEDLMPMDFKGVWAAMEEPCGRMLETWPHQIHCCQQFLYQKALMSMYVVWIFCWWR
ncbi:unnamed protein product [Prunus brigantina]